MKLKCKECNKEFNGKPDRQFCSRKCSIDNRKRNPEYIEKLRKKKVQITKDYVLCKECGVSFFGNINRQYCSLLCSCKHKGTIAERITNICKECGVEMIKLKSRQRMFCTVKCLNNYKAKDPDFCKKLSESCTERSKNQDYLEKLSVAQSAKWAKPEFREKMTAIIQSDEWNNKVEKNSKKFKDYVLPSGKTVRVQGYENYALDILLQQFDETDIFIQRKEIENEVGKITYTFNSNEHMYIPDIYIKSLNKIIEVKSSWTYKSQYELNKLKEQACKDLGFAFEFMIL